MRTCPRCGEINGDNNADCYKCGATIGPVREQSLSSDQLILSEKVCPRCKKIYSARVNQCEDCHIPLVMRKRIMMIDNKENEMELWLYIIAILFPMIGVIIGLIYIAQKRESGPKVLGISIATSVICTFLLFFISSCAAS